MSHGTHMTKSWHAHSQHVAYTDVLRICNIYADDDVWVSVRVSWLGHMRTMTRVYVCHDSFNVWQGRTHWFVCHDTFTCVPQLIYTCARTHCVLMCPCVCLKCHVCVCSWKRILIFGNTEIMCLCVLGYTYVYTYTWCIHTYSHTHLSICLSVCQSICLSICLLDCVCLQGWLFVYLSVYLPICLSFCLSVWPSYMYVCMYVCMHVRISVIRVCSSWCDDQTEDTSKGCVCCNGLTYATLILWKQKQNTQKVEASATIHYHVQD